MGLGRLGLLLAVLPAMALAGCGIPTTGPRGEAIDREESVTHTDKEAKLPYCRVLATPQVVSVAQEHQPRLTGALTKVRHRDYRVRIGVGDVLNITIFEAAGGGLFF